MILHGQIEVVYENGVLRPLTALPDKYHDNQHLIITIEGDAATAGAWLADADPTVSLEEVRRALGKVDDKTFAQAIYEEREER